MPRQALSGLGLRKKPPRTMKTMRKDLVAIMKGENEHKRLVALGDYKMQANWMSVGIDNMMHKDLTWNKLLYQCSDRLVKLPFQIG